MSIRRIMMVATAIVTFFPLLASGADKTSELKFISQVQAAFDTKDSAKLLALVCWDRVEPSLKQSMEKEFANLVTRTPSNIKLVPSDPSQKYKYSRDGVSYRPNLLINKLLIIDLRPGSLFDTIAAEMLVGEKQGRLLIAMAAPSK